MGSQEGDLQILLGVVSQSNYIMVRNHTHTIEVNIVVMLYFLYFLFQVVDKGMDENEVAQVIIDKLMESTAVVSFAEIARAAKAVNRSVLAAKVKYLPLLFDNYTALLHM